MQPVSMGHATAPRWDVFLSYASEDKVFARDVNFGLKRAGLRVWFAEFELTAGDSLRRSISRGLRDARYGLVILSSHFFRKEWPQKELDGLVAREHGEQKVVLPVWLDVDADDVREYSPLLADRVGIISNGSSDAVVGEVLRALFLGAADESGWTPHGFLPHDNVDTVVLPVKPRGERSLCLGRHPVSNAEYRAFVDSEGYPVPDGVAFVRGRRQESFKPWDESAFADADMPVVCVSFWDALEYCAWLEGRIGLSVIPQTVEVWEFAAKWDLRVAGIRSVGLAQLATVTGMALHFGADGPASRTTAERRSNRLGLSDLWGNIWEWGGMVPGSAAVPAWVAAPKQRPCAEGCGAGFLEGGASSQQRLSGEGLPYGSATRHFDLGFRVAVAAPVERLASGCRTLLEHQSDALEETWEAIENPIAYAKFCRDLERGEAEL